MTRTIIKYLGLMLLLCVVITLLNSCITDKKRMKICSECKVKTEHKDSIVYKIKDTTIFITQKGPTQYLENPCKHLCDSAGNLKPFLQSKIDKGIRGTIKSVGNSIAFDCDADSLKEVIHGLREKEHFIKDKETVVSRCDKEHRTSWDGFCRIFTLGGLLIIGIYVSFRLIKKFIFKK